MDTDFNDEAKADLTAMGYPDAIVRGMGAAFCWCSDRPGSTCEESLERAIEQYVPLPGAVVAGFYWYHDPEYANGCGYMGWRAMGCWKQCGDWQDPDLEALTLVAGITKGKVASKELKEGEVVSAYFPLGSEFSFELKRKEDESLLVSEYKLDVAILSPPVRGDALFGDDVVIIVDEKSPGEKRHFRAVHLGSQKVTISPTDGDVSPVTVEINIVPPVSLGEGGSKYDEVLTYWGNQFGIPPQYLKGQVRQESNFNATAYRYEPLGADMRYVSMGQNLRKKSPYSLYRLATDDDLSQGAEIVLEDISPRNKYYITLDGEKRLLTDEDEKISAQNIYETNDRVQNWGKVDPKRAALLKKDPDLLNFTAQTPVSSSYGLLQVMYATAIAPMRWKGSGGNKNPSYLFDSCIDVSAGSSCSDSEGGLKLGGGYLVRVFVKANQADVEFEAPEEFANAYKRALNYYNHSKPSLTGSYGVKIMGFSESYLPESGVAIFQ